MTKLRIALQKKGRLSDDSLALLKEAGIKINLGMSNLIAEAANFPLQVLFLRDDDIPQTVADGTADLGIVGENELFEKGYSVPLVKKLGFSKCRISLAIPQEENYTGPEYFNNKKVATSYPSILRNYFNTIGVNADIHTITGSVEIAPGIGLSNAIFDIVSSGSTLLANRLKEVEVVMKSEAVLVSKPILEPDKQKILEELLFRIDAVQAANSNKYILMNVPNENLEQVINILPGMKSPTVLPLYKTGWSSVHTVIKENRFWEIIGQLKQKGAEGILVVPIEKMIL